MRFRLRHTQQTIVDHIEAQLMSLGWMTVPPWGTPPVIMREVQPDQVEELQENLVSVLVEGSGDDEVAELGGYNGGLMMVEYDVIVDVYGENLSITHSIIDDMKEVISNRVITVNDYSQSPPIVAPGHELEFVNVMMVRPTGSVNLADIKRSWRSLSFQARLHFPA